MNGIRTHEPVTPVSQGHGFESRSSLNFFFSGCFFNCLSEKHTARIIISLMFIRSSHIWFSYIYIDKLQTTIYRKPTHTDRLIDESAYNPTSYKATTIRTLKRRARLVCEQLTYSLTDETKHIDNVFSKNYYNPDFVKRNVYKNSEPNTTNAKPVTTATIPYVKGISETIVRTLQHPCRSQTDMITTLRQLLTNVKDKDEPNDRQGAVYKIKCCNCQASYIGETDRNLNIRLTERKRATKNGDVITDPMLNTIYTRMTDLTGTLRLPNALLTVRTTTSDSLYQQLPVAYKRLVNRTDKQKTVFADKFD